MDINGNSSVKIFSEWQFAEKRSIEKKDRERKREKGLSLDTKWQSDLVEEDRQEKGGEEGSCPLFRKERIEGSRVGLGKEASITQHGDGAGNLSAKPLLITLPPSTTAAAWNRRENVYLPTLCKRASLQPVSSCTFTRVCVRERRRGNVLRDCIRIAHTRGNGPMPPTSQLSWLCCSRCVRSVPVRAFARAGARADHDLRASQPPHCAPCVSFRQPICVAARLIAASDDGFNELLESSVARVCVLARAWIDSASGENLRYRSSSSCRSSIPDWRFFEASFTNDTLKEILRRFFVERRKSVYATRRCLFIF